MALTNQDKFNMIEHWLSAPENGYIGSGYGGKNVALSAPEGSLSDELSKEFMNKLREDIPSLADEPLAAFKSKQSLTFALGNDSKTYGLQA